MKPLAHCTDAPSNVTDSHSTGSHQGPHEKRLLNHLLGNYNTLERPVSNESDALTVRFGLTLQQIIDVVNCLFSPLYASLLFVHFNCMIYIYFGHQLHQSIIHKLREPIEASTITCYKTKAILTGFLRQTFMSFIQWHPLAPAGSIADMHKNNLIFSAQLFFFHTFAFHSIRYQHTISVCQFFSLLYSAGWKKSDSHDKCVAKFGMYSKSNDSIFHLYLSRMNIKQYVHWATSKKNRVNWKFNRSQRA